MRTTLTLEDDVAAELEDRMRREGRSMKDLVNDLLRRGLRSGDAPLPSREAVRIETFSSPFATGIDAGRLNQLNDDLEVAEFLRKRGSEAP
jgi:hypothetical protein